MTTKLFRMLRVGDTLSFDQGRVKLRLEDKSGRTARLCLTLSEDVVIDKPRTAANELFPDPRAAISKASPA